MQDAVEGGTMRVKFTDGSEHWHGETSRARTGLGRIVSSRVTGPHHLSRSKLRKAAAAFRSTAVVGVDGFHPKVPCDPSDECC